MTHYLRNIFIIVLCLTVSLLWTDRRPLCAAPARTGDEITIAVKSSPDATFQTTLTIQSPSLLKAFRRSSTSRKVKRLPLTDTTVTAIERGRETVYLFGPDGRLYNRDKGKVLTSPPLV